MECCGEPFAVGDHVTWPVLEVERSDRFEELFRGTRVVVDACYSLHGDETEDVRLRRVTGRVEAAEVVFGPGGWVDVEGGAVRVRLTAVDRSHPEAPSEAVDLLGYLVTLA